MAFSLLVLATLSEVPAAAGGSHLSLLLFPKFYAAAPPRSFSQKSNPYRVQLTTRGTPGPRVQAPWWLWQPPTVFCVIPEVMTTKSVPMANEQLDMAWLSSSSVCLCSLWVPALLPVGFPEPLFLPAHPSNTLLWRLWHLNWAKPHMVAPPTMIGLGMAA